MGVTRVPQLVTFACPLLGSRGELAPDASEIGITCAVAQHGSSDGFRLIASWTTHFVFGDIPTGWHRPR